MSMHLVGPHMTTTNYSKRKSKKVSNKMRQAQEKHQMFLDSMGVGKRTELKGVDVVDNTYRRKQKLSNMVWSGWALALDAVAEELFTKSAMDNRNLNTHCAVD